MVELSIYHSPEKIHLLCKLHIIEKLLFHIAQVYHNLDLLLTNLIATLELPLHVRALMHMMLPETLLL
jgi:hypothetical protein